MKFYSKATAIILTAAMTIPLFSPALIGNAAANVMISPDNVYEINNGVFEGWGSSLCWWGNRVGYSDSLSQQAAEAFYGDDGLRMNIVRYNIGGGDDPSHTHITRTDSNMPGYTKYNNGTVTYDWNADANQRNALKHILDACGDDAIVEMFSNSPPYYMTKSGCSCGSKDAVSNNLKDDYYDDFAEYLAEVCYHYEKEWGIKVQSLEPMNEPYTDFWKANSYKQEGCHFDQGTSESNLLIETKKALLAKGLDDIIVSGCDESSLDTQISSFEKLSDDAKAVMGRIDTHTYSGSNRTKLRETAKAAGKNLWMSEVDNGGTAGSNAGQMGSGLWLADRIVLDMNGLNSSAWVLWQLIDNHICAAGLNGRKDSGMPNIEGGFWGVAVADHDNNNIILTKKYYTFGQFTRYIRPGMTMLKSSDSTLAAYDKENGQLVIVAVNDTGSAKDFSFDLSEFDTVGSYAQTIRTSISENWKDVGNSALSGTALNVSTPSNSVTTYIINGVSGGADLTNRISVTSGMVSGSKPWNDSSDTCQKVFDGKNDTFFDGLSEGYVQVDLGAEYNISAIGFCPRNGYEYRCPDARFMISEDGVNWTTMYTIKGKPLYGMNYVSKLEAKKGRYIKYAVPSGTPNNSYNKDSSYCCNIAEIELYGTPDTISEFEKIDISSIKGSDPWKNTDNTAQKAFDGNAETFFDGLAGGWIEADLGDTYSINAIGFCPRKGYESRCVDGKFSISTDGTNWTELYTIKNNPPFGMQYISDFTGDTAARYIRYEIPTGTPTNQYNKESSYNCNIAEIEVYGSQKKSIDGDINKDGILNGDDLKMLSAFLHGQGTITDCNAADLDHSEEIDVFDMILLRSKLAK